MFSYSNWQVIAFRKESIEAILPVSDYNILNINAMKKYTCARIGLSIGLLSFNILSSCVSTRQGMDAQGGSATQEMDTQKKRSISDFISKLGPLTSMGNAILNNNLGIVKILAKDKDPNIINNTGSAFTSLLLALICEHVEIAKILLTEGGDGLDVESKDPDSGGTALHMAAEKGYGGVVDLLLEKYRDKIDVNAKNNDGNTPFYLAFQKGYLNLCKTIDPDQFQTLKSFHDAVASGDLAKLCEILFEINGLEKQDKEIFLNSVLDGTTALGKAIEKGHKSIVQQLLINENQIDINKTGDGSILTSLLLAVHCGCNQPCNHPEIAKVLLIKGEDRLNVTDVGPNSAKRQPVHWAAING